MKKLAFLPILLCLLLFSGCHGQRYGILSYQEKEIYAECVLNGEYKIAVSQKSGEKSVSFLEPSELSSISFIEKDGKITACAKDVEIPFESGDLKGISALLSMFSLSEEALTYAGTGGDGEILEFSYASGEYILTMNDIGLPKRIQIYSESFNYDILVNFVKLN